MTDQPRTIAYWCEPCQAFVNEANEPPLLLAYRVAEVKALDYEKGDLRKMHLCPGHASEFTRTGRVEIRKTVKAINTI